MLTLLPHIAGSQTNNDLAKNISNTWKQLKLDKVEQIEYNVLLQYPNDTNPNKFQIVSSSGDVIFDAPTAQLEPALTDDEKKLGVARPFNAYSGVGSAKVSEMCVRTYVCVYVCMYVCCMYVLHACECLV